MDEKSYKTLLAKPPEGIGGWPLVLIIEFKDAVYEANIALSRSRSAKGWSKRLLKKPKKYVVFTDSKTK